MGRSRAITGYSLSRPDRQVFFYQNSGILYKKYDRMSRIKIWALPEDRGLPILFGRNESK